MAQKHKNTYKKQLFGGHYGSFTVTVIDAYIVSWQGKYRLTDTLLGLAQWNVELPKLLFNYSATFKKFP